MTCRLRSVRGHRRFGVALAALIGGGGLSLLSAGTATAAVEIGETSESAVPCVGNFSLAQDVAAPPRNYTVPDGGGVITAWKLQEDGPGDLARLKVYRRTADPSEFFTVGESAEETTAPDDPISSSPGFQSPVGTYSALPPAHRPTASPIPAQI
jgi:hypothetical protein